VWCEKPSNCQLEYTQHGGLTCKSTRRTRRLARLQPGRSARRPARRCVVCTRVACHHPSMVCHLVVTGTLSAFRPAPARLNPFIRRIRAGVKPVRLAHGVQFTL